MTPTQQLQAFTQSVYLVIKGRHFDDITSEDGVTLVAQTIDWTNMYIDELETELDNEGRPINWTWARSLGASLGTATEGEASVSFDTNTYSGLIAEEGRYVQILQDNAVISNWAVVSIDQITDKTDRVTEDMVALVGTTLVFSRNFKDTEDGGDIIGDVMTPLPRLSLTNINVLKLVKPKLLLILGVAKNASLPDIVKGSLSPSYAQKYSDLLKNAIAKAGASSRSDKASRDDYADVRGVY